MKRYLTRGLGLMLLCLTGMSGTAQRLQRQNVRDLLTDHHVSAGIASFPVTIGNVPVVKVASPDTPGRRAIQFCPMGILACQVGLVVATGEPMALTNVTRSPYCMVNLGRFNINIGNVGSGTGGTGKPRKSRRVLPCHWYKYPLTYWLQHLSPQWNTHAPSGRRHGWLSVRAGPDVGRKAVR